MKKEDRAMKKGNIILVFIFGTMAVFLLFI